MAINVGSLLVSLGLDSAEFKTGLTQAEKEFKKSTKRIEATGNGMANLGKKMSLAITAPLVALGVTSVKAAVESNKAFKSIETTLASMGARAGFTANQLAEVASDTMRKSLYDDDEVLQKVTNTLLTFGNVSGETFLRAQQAAVDLSAKFGKDLQGSAIMVGKALENPVKGLTALTRVGVSFSPAQEKLIKSLVEGGRAAEAQGVILKALEGQVIGSAQAMRDADPMAGLRLSFGEFQEEIGKKLLPLLPRLTDALTKVLDAFGKLSPGMQEALLIGAGLAAVFGPLLIVIGSMTSAIAPYVAGIKLATTVANEAGVATTGLKVGLASLRAGLLTLVATLGPWALALGAIAGAYYIVKMRSDEVTTATAKYTKAQAEANARSEKATGLLGQMATANAKLRAEIIARAKADRQAAIAALAKAKADLIALRAETARLNAFRDAGRKSIGSTDPRFASLMPSAGANRAVNQNNRNEEALTATIKDNNSAIATLTSVIESNTVPGVADIKVDKPSGASGGGGSGPSGPTAAEIEQRFQDELASYASQAISSMAQLAMIADERAEYELRGVELARLRTLEQIKSDKEYDDTQKARLTKQVEALVDLEREQIERSRLAELERQQADLAQIEFDRQRELLGFQANLADTQAERKRIALQILALEQQYRRQQLEMVLASQVATDAEKRRAQAILDSLAAIEAGETAAASRANETDVERYLRSLNKSPEQINEAIDSIKISGLEALSDGLVDAIVNFKSLADVAKSVVKQVLAELLKLQIQQAIIKPLAAAMGLSIPGFAKGTNFAPGGMAIVGERGPELVNLPRGSQVIPNHELRGMSRNDNGNSFNITVNGAMNDREARRTGYQIASAAQQRMAIARREGVAG